MDFPYVSIHSKPKGARRPALYVPPKLTKIWATSVMGDHQVAMEKFTWMNWATSILGNLNIL